MNNVTQLSTARQAEAGQQSRPAAANPIAALIAAIDKALGDKWSFDIVHHETVGDETVIFVKLLVDGRYRIGIGGTVEKGTLVHRLNAAAIDALARAAEWMGTAIIAAATTTTLTEPAPASPTEAASRITRKQLDYAISLARDRGIPRDKLAARCLSEFKKKPEYLTRNEASSLIESLKEVA